MCLRHSWSWGKRRLKFRAPITTRAYLQTAIHARLNCRAGPQRSYPLSRTFFCSPPSRNPFPWTSVTHRIQFKLIFVTYSYYCHNFIFIVSTLSLSSTSCNWFALSPGLRAVKQNQFAWSFVVVKQVAIFGVIITQRNGSEVTSQRATSLLADSSRLQARVIKTTPTAFHFLSYFIVIPSRS